MTFVEGQSGNRAGRPPGSRNKATRLAEGMFQGEAETIIRMALDKAREGDMTAIRICLDRVFPRLRDNGAPDALLDAPPQAPRPVFSLFLTGPAAPKALQRCESFKGRR